VAVGLGNVLRCGTTLRSMVARLSTTGTGDPLTRLGSRLSSLRNSAWTAAGGCWTSGAVPASSPYDLAHLFEGAVGLDPDPAMIAEGRRAARKRDIANITWIQG
jgi:hypothetical protein